MRARLAPQQRAAAVSVLAAAVLIALKLVVGLVSHSLGLVAEAAHSATDLVAALLTFFAVGVAARPADRDHPFGHGKAEHLSALAEGAFLLAASLFIAYEGVDRLTGAGQRVHVRWYTFATLGVVIALDAFRALSSRRAGRRYDSAALRAGAVHFASDLLGTATVLVGLVLARAGHSGADAVAALLVAVLVMLSAARIMRANVRVLMDTAPGGVEDAARDAILGLQPSVDLRRLRIRSAGSRHFADVVVGVDADAGLAHGHAVAEAIEAAIEARLPGSDVVVHVEPSADDLAPLRQRATAAALEVPEVREVHNVTALEVGEGTELSLHMKLPSDLSLHEAHRIATRVERAIVRAEPRVRRVLTHIEPLAEDLPGRVLGGSGVRGADTLVRQVVRELTGEEPRELRFRQTDRGTVAFVTLALEPGTGLVDAHSAASEIEQRVRVQRPEIIDVHVHTEPA